RQRIGQRRPLNIDIEAVLQLRDQMLVGIDPPAIAGRHDMQGRHRPGLLLDHEAKLEDAPPLVDNQRVPATADGVAILANEHAVESGPFRMPLIDPDMLEPWCIVRSPYQLRFHGDLPLSKMPRAVTHPCVTALAGPAPRYAP